MIVKKSPDDFREYLKDASNFKGNAEKIYFPENQIELKDLIKDLSSRKTPYTISGAGTGLSGGRVPLEGSIIATDKLNNILHIDKEKKSFITEPGVYLSDILSRLAEINFFYPPNPTETNSFIGGNIAANSSGARTFKYGPTRKFVKKLKIILPAGDELILERGLHKAKGYSVNIESDKKHYKFELPEIAMPEGKHAAGYFIKPNMDILDLFIGSEGTLGTIAEAELDMVELPEVRTGLIIYFDNIEKCFGFIKEARNRSRRNNQLKYTDVKDISARLIEFYDKNSLKLLKEYYSQINTGAVAAVWIEQEHSHDNEEEFC